MENEEKLQEAEILRELEANLREEKQRVVSLTLSFEQRVSQMAAGLERTAERIREQMARVKQCESLYDMPLDVQGLSRDIMDEMFALPQRVPERYMVQDAMELVRRRVVVAALEQELMSLSSKEYTDL